MKLNPLFCAILILAPTLTAVSALGQLPPPPAAHQESGTTVTRTKGGSPRWKNAWTMEKVTVDGSPMVRFTETGEGTYAPFRERVRWTIDALWTAGTAFRPLRVEKTVTSMQGHVLQREIKLFNAEKGTARFEREGSRNPRDILLKVPPDTLAPEGLAAALRSLPFGRDRSVDAHVLSNEPKVYEASFEFRGRERVTTALGGFDCYKVELVPDLGMLSLFRFMAPKVYFWFTVEPPHFWVKYEGPESGPGSPNVVMEIQSYERIVN